MSTQEKADCCRQQMRRRAEFDGELEELPETLDTNKQEYMRVIGLQCPYRIVTRVSSIEEQDDEDRAEQDDEDRAEQDDEDRAEDELESIDSTNMSAEEDCTEYMMPVNGMMYHVEDIDADIISTMTEFEKNKYELLLKEYNYVMCK